MHQTNRGHDYPYLNGVRRDGCPIRSIVKAREDELNAVSEYIYQSILLEDTHPELAALLDSIAMDEMKHFRGLSRMLYCMGCDPGVRGTVKSSRIKTEDGRVCGIGKLLASDIADEKRSERDYLCLAASTGDPVAACFFTNLADDEARHVKLLCEARDRASSPN